MLHVAFNGFLPPDATRCNIPQPKTKKTTLGDRSPERPREYLCFQYVGLCLSNPSPAHPMHKSAQNRTSVTITL